MRRRQGRTSMLALVAALLLGTGALGAAIWHGQRLPDGPEPIAWDRAPCAHCHMLIGDPHFAAEIITADGTVLAFDDPGCLLAYVAERRPALHRVWFHDARGDGWIPGDRARFVLGEQTPMGYGLGAVAPGTPGARSRAEAEAIVAKGPGGGGMP
jgi:copper chaperone NosL